jgi:hypothetical protein
MELASLKLRMSTIRQHKSCVCTTIRQTTGKDHSSDTILTNLLKGMEKEAPPPKSRIPEWNLNVVLEALSKPPFEPLNEVDIKHLTFKTVFLVAWGTAARVSELHALTMDRDHLRFEQTNKWVELTASMEFLAKNQLATQPPRKFRLQALKNKKILCPVRAVRIYLDKTKDLRGDRKKLFISMVKSSTKIIGIRGISRWLRDTIVECYRMGAPQDMDDTLGAHAHEVRALAASLAVAGHRPIKEVMRAAYWRSESCFTKFYLKDMAKYQNQNEGHATVAASTSMDI